MRFNTETVLEIAKKLKADAAGNAQATMTEIDLAVAMLESLAKERDQLRAKQSPTGPRYTSVSKGGSYTKLGAIRGAGSLKGLAGIAYQNEKGDLFIREPECFAKRMVLAPDPADAKDGEA